jgi:hypothetical protein
MSGEEKLQILQGKRYAKWRNVDKWHVTKNDDYAEEDLINWNVVGP